MSVYEFFYIKKLWKRYNKTDCKDIGNRTFVISFLKGKKSIGIKINPEKYEKTKNSTKNLNAIMLYKTMIILTIMSKKC